MRLVSVNIGHPREVIYKGKTVTTGIFKEPVEGRIRLRTLNLDGDRQADLSVHGGLSKAAYAYPIEHYAYWRAEFPGMNLPWGMFGENFTTEGLREDSVNIGDRFRIGSAEVMVTEPRLPCYKLAAKSVETNTASRLLTLRGCTCGKRMMWARSDALCRSQPCPRAGECTLESGSKNS
ncbi:MAG: MOSC domain containing protein [candidate division NC10 bacterium]|nr:MOSC domain containing protein [candidate division NC10 bacterium]